MYLPIKQPITKLEREEREHVKKSILAISSVRVVLNENDMEIAV